MKIKDNLGNYVFVLPALVIFTIFYIIPFLWVFQLGMFDWDGISPAKIFVGLENFKEIFILDKSWWQAMRNAIYITLIALTFQNTLAFLLALACNRQMKLKDWYRTIFFIPPILSEIVVGLAWKFIINDVEGANLINRMLITFGFPQLVHRWLYEPKIALTTVAFIHSWKGFGFAFLIFLAGLKIIPKELYEAAYVDGANAWSVFRRITLPLMMPVIGLVAILTILGTMQAFVLIISLVGGEMAGHTSVPVLRILAAMRGSSRFGYACAEGITFGMILVALSFLQLKLLKRIRAA